MWGFGIYLMHLVDYLARRNHDKKERRSKTEQHLNATKECHICGKDFYSETLDSHIKEKHSDIL
jgi:hypothetical protein